jgi:glycine/D-amino acid oxidase-like deaminating enzyme
VSQHPADPALTPLYEETLRLYADLEAHDAGFRMPPAPAGLLFVAHEGASGDGLAAVRRLATAIDAEFPEQRPEVLLGVALRGLEPGLAPGLVACRVELGHPVPPAASTYAYATLAERRGAVIRTGRRAGLLVERDRVIGVELDGMSLLAGAVIVAAGPWTPEVVDPTGRWRPIRRLWGVVVELELASPPGHVLEEAGIDAILGGELVEAMTPHESTASHHHAEARAGSAPVAREFSLCTAAGVSAVGSTFLPIEPDAAAWMEPLLARGAGFVPGIAGAPIRGVRACARPRSVDGRPLIGPLPGLANALVCAGHGPWGISTGPASARLVADLVLGRPVVIPPELDAARFAGAPAAGRG